MAKARVLLVATTVLLVAATLAAYLTWAVVDSEEFADRATAALQDADVRQVVADRVTDELVLSAKPDVLAARPLIVATVSSAVAGDAFARLFRRGALGVHRAVFRRDQDAWTLTLVDAGILVAAALRERQPGIASRVPSEERLAVLQRDLGAGADVLRLADDLWPVFAVLALLSAIAAVAVAPDRRAATRGLGVAVAIAGLLIVAGEAVTRELALDRVRAPDDRVAAAAVWDAFLGDLARVGWLIAACGAVVGLAAASLMLLERRARAPRRRPRLAVPLAAALLIGAAFAAFATAGGIDEPAPEVSAGCNGHAELCDRPLDEVTLAATHNAMSVPLPGWYAALQDRPIREQLDDGIRGLLLDTHYADRLENGRTRTYFGSREDLRQAAEQDPVSARAVAAAERLRGRLGFRGPGERGMYLCHTFCELGATPLSDVLDDVHEFLVTHPGDVLVMINQDYVTPKDFVGAIDDAGLTRFALTPPAGADWPTLREMVDQDRRLVVLAENEAGAAPWYQLVYERLTQETPFSFARPTQLTDPDTLAATCRPNRGEAGAPLFLVNHWINTDPAPRPSNAAVVNAHAPLLERARTCERIRGRDLNLLAVDFYRRGDVFNVVDTLNGI